MHPQGGADPRYWIVRRPDSYGLDDCPVGYSRLRGTLPPGPSALGADIRSVGDLWVATAYDDLRRAGPDRATQVRWVLDRYVNRWLALRVGTVGDITCFRVHAWLCWMYWSRGPYSFMGGWHRTSSVT